MRFSAIAAILLQGPRAWALSGWFEGTAALNLQGPPFADLCARKTAECKVQCGGVVKDQSCSETTGQWTCNCGEVPELKGTGSAKEKPFTETCVKKTLDCSNMCKGITSENTCSPTTGKWSCKCGAAPPKIGSGGGGNASEEPYKAKCEKKKEECEATCKGTVKEQSCSVTTGKYSCKCGAAPSVGGSWKKFSVKISTASALADAVKLMTVIDAFSWKVKTTMSVGKLKVSAGDILLKEGAMKGNLIVESSKLKIGSVLIFKTKTSASSSRRRLSGKTTGKTESGETASWRKKGSWKKVTISVESSKTISALASKVDTQGALTEGISLGGIKLSKGDRLLEEGSLKKVSSSSSTIVDRLKSLTTGTLVVDVEGLATPSSRRRYTGTTSRCHKYRASCGVRCGGAIAAWSCSWSSKLGTKYSCRCTDSSGCTGGRCTTETAITSRVLLQTIVKNIDVKTLTFTRDMKIGKQLVSEGDKLLKEGGLSGKTSISVSSLLKLKTAHLKILHVKTSKDTDKVTGKTEDKTGKTTGKITLGKGTVTARLKMLEQLVMKQQEEIASLRTCAATCCKGKCAKVSPSPRPSSSRRRRRIQRLPTDKASSRRRLSISGTLR